MKHNVWRLYMMSLIVLLTGCMPIDIVSPVSNDEPAKMVDDSQWHMIKQMVIEHSTAMVGFLDGERGLTVGCHGVIRYSVDGGTTWSNTNSRGQCLWGMDIIDENIAWSVGNKGQVGFSKDGWHTWHNTKISDYDNNFVSFIDKHTGWVVSAGAKMLWSTRDGGKTWTQIILPKGIKTIVDVMLRTPENGYILDHTGHLFMTNDAGQSWMTQSLGLGKAVIPWYTHTAAICFLDTQSGVIVLNLQKNGNTIMIAMYTADGGQTWTQEPVPAQPGFIYLSHDGKLLTVIENEKNYNAGFNMMHKITIFRHQVPSLVNAALQ